MDFNRISGFLSEKQRPIFRLVIFLLFAGFQAFLKLKRQPSVIGTNTLRSYKAYTRGGGCSKSSKLESKLSELAKILAKSFQYRYISRVT